MRETRMECSSSFSTAPPSIRRAVGSPQTRGRSTVEPWPHVRKEGDRRRACGGGVAHPPTLRQRPVPRGCGAPQRLPPAAYRTAHPISRPDGGWRLQPAIEADLAFTAEWATDETIGDFPLRRPPKVSGSIRVVRVGDLDCVACGGVHVERTGEIRLVRAVGVETIRGRVRIAWKIGDRAIAHYRLCSEIVSSLGASLSAQPDELVERVARQEERSRELDLEQGRAGSPNACTRSSPGTSSRRRSR